MLINQVVSTPYSTYGGILESYRSETTVKQNVCIGVYFENTGSYPDTRDSCSEPRESQSSWGCPGSAKTPAFFYTPPPCSWGLHCADRAPFVFFFSSTAARLGLTFRENPAIANDRASLGKSCSRSPRRPHGYGCRNCHAAHTPGKICIRYETITLVRDPMK